MSTIARDSQPPTAPRDDARPAASDPTSSAAPAAAPLAGEASRRTAPPPRWRPAERFDTGEARATTVDAPRVDPARADAAGAPPVTPARVPTPTAEPTPALSAVAQAVPLPADALPDALPDAATDVATAGAAARPRRRRLLVGGATVVAVGALVAWALRPAVLDVEVGVVARAPLVVTVDAEGRTRVRDRYVVTAPVAGRVERLTLAEGAAVRAGAPVARLLPLPLDATTDAQARARLDAALAAARAAGTAPAGSATPTASAPSSPSWPATRRWPPPAPRPAARRPTWMRRAPESRAGGWPPGRSSSPRRPRGGCSASPSAASAWSPPARRSSSSATRARSRS